MNRLRLGMSVARCLGCAGIAALFIFWSTAPANAVVKTDNFTGAFDYGGEPTNADGTFTAGPVGIWEGSWNMPNLAGGSFDADFTDAGALHIDDNNLATVSGAGAGVGWEGGRSTAPLLWTSVPGNQDFTATVKITAQTAGFWSAAGLIARAGNSPTPPGVGTDNDDENFITATTFRTDAANPSSGNTLNKRIEAGAQLDDNNFAIGPALGEALPNWVRLEKIGNVYRTWASLDGVNFQFQSRVTPTAGNALEDTSVAKQVGPSYMNYGGQAGSATFDDFSLDIHDPLPAPGAPNLSTSPLSITVPTGTLIQQLVSDSTGGQGPMAWARVADAGNPARPAANPPLSSMIPGAQGGAFLPPLPPAPAFGSSYFRWDTTGWKIGTYKYTISATNDWGQSSNGVLLTINLIPEPATLTLAAIGLIGAYGLVRRRRC